MTFLEAMRRCRALHQSVRREVWKEGIVVTFNGTVTPWVYEISRPGDGDPMVFVPVAEDIAADDWEEAR